MKITVVEVAGKTVVTLEGKNGKVSLVKNPSGKVTINGKKVGG